jgi:predicted ATPase
MSKKTNGGKDETTPTGITQITVAGYKSISDQQSIEIRPLTILAGANSSGKSSIMQPLLLLKQTLEATYDPGPLLINGPNVRFTSIDQLLSNVTVDQRAQRFSVSICVDQQAWHSSLAIHFRKSAKTGLQIQKMDINLDKTKNGGSFRAGMSHEDIVSNYGQAGAGFEELDMLIFDDDEYMIIRERCFLVIAIKSRNDGRMHGKITSTRVIESYIRQIIHLPGLRGNAERSFPVTAIGPNFPGTFQEYCASIIAKWQTDKNHQKLKKLGKDLERLRLTWKVTAKPINDAQIELQVGRLSHATRGGAHDLVSIADVGFGVSQTLPVLVALLVAEPGQLVYIEEPEIHLHPRAQSAMAQILADAANRGVRVVIETHSQLLLLGIQTLVAEGKLSPDLVKLHWFKRRNDGSTEINSADLNEAGAFGNWPEDFAEVALEAESRYLDAAESKPSIH